MTLQGKSTMKKTMCFIVLFALLAGICGTCCAEAAAFPGAPVIGIAWRADTDSEFFTGVCRAVEEAGGTWVLLDQVFSVPLVFEMQVGGVLDSHGITVFDLWCKDRGFS